MRKIVIAIVLVLSIFGCYQIVAQGIVTQTVVVPNYSQIQASSKEIDTLISKLSNVNDIEYVSKKAELDEAIQTYQAKKEKYEEMQEIVNKNSDVEISLVDIYDVDFLWTIIGNYGTEEGISLKFDVAKSATSTVTSEQYTMCDLKFTVAGDYIAITDFIYDLEDDSRLGFEISNFSMTPNNDKLQATFTVREVPVNNKNLTQFTTSVDTNNTNTVSTNTVNQ